MKFEVRDKVQEDEGTVTFFLRDDGDGIYLMAEEEDGTPWYIAKITTDGKLVRCNGVPNHLGLDLDKTERIVEVEE